MEGKDPCQTFKGNVKDTDRAVRLSINENGISGFIQLEGQKLFITRSIKFKLPGGRPTLFVAYYEKDVDDRSDIQCGVTSEHDKKILETLPKPSGSERRSSHCLFLKIATEADFAFFQLNGGATNAEILDIINLIEGVYISTFDVFLRVTFQNVWTTNDPYTGNPLTTAGASLLLSQFASYWQTNFISVTRDVAHLFTGVNAYVAGTAGVAYRGTICNNPPLAYGLTRERFQQFLTTAHEIGHNFDGRHEDGVSCDTPSASIMCQGIKQIPMYFSATSITRISNFINANSACLNPALYFRITGNAFICTSEQYSVANLSPSGTVSWSVSPTNLATLSTSGQVATLTLIQNGSVTLTASISDGCSTPIVISRVISLEGKEINTGGMTVQRNPSHGCVSNGQAISFGLVSAGTWGCNLLSLGVSSVEWQFHNHGSAFPNLTQNAGYYACGSPQPSNTGITISFTNMPSTPFMITLRFRIRNRCGVWNEFSPGFSFQIARC